MKAAKFSNNDPYDLDLALAEAAQERARRGDAQENALKDDAAERPQGSEVPSRWVSSPHHNISIARRSPAQPPKPIVGPRMVIRSTEARSVKLTQAD